MPYFEETVVAGRVIEKKKKYSARLGTKGIPRSKNQSVTPEDVEAVNQRNAERHLRWLLNANYHSGDFHIVATFNARWNPSPEEAKAEYAKFMRRARNLYRKEGLPFKYVSAMERGQRGEHKIHFHIVVNYMDPRKLSAIWPWGRIKFMPLDDSGQYGALASYIIKRTSKTFRAGEGFKKRYNPSSNLVIPKPVNKKISRNRWLLEPRARKGYYIEKEKTFNGISRVNGYPMQFYSMVKLPENPPRRI